MKNQLTLDITVGEKLLGDILAAAGTDLREGVRAAGRTVEWKPIVDVIEKAVSDHEAKTGRPLPDKISAGMNPEASWGAYNPQRPTEVRISLSPALAAKVLHLATASCYHEAIVDTLIDRVRAERKAAPVAAVSL